MIWQPCGARPQLGLQHCAAIRPRISPPGMVRGVRSGSCWSVPLPLLPLPARGGQAIDMVITGAEFGAAGTLGVISWADKARGLAEARTMGMVRLALFFLFFSIEVPQWLICTAPAAPCANRPSPRSRTGRALPSGRTCPAAVRPRLRARRRLPRYSRSRS